MTGSRSSNKSHKSAAAAARSPLRGLWPLAHGLGLMAALWLAWWLLAQANFFYPVWYNWLSIDAHIEEFAPQNRYRFGFAGTDRAERERLFAAIVDAIHDGGRGLAELRYHNVDGADLGPLLRPPEVQHLEDVARLVDLGRVAGLICLAAWLALLALLLHRRVAMPSVRRQFVGLGAVCALGLLVVLVLGPVEVFYALHEWIFPPGHQWFFYYQESLMTTLMKAPDLFGGMAANWLLLAVILVAGQWWGLAAALRALGVSRRENP